MLKEIVVFEASKKSMQGTSLHRGHLQIFVEILNFCEKPQVKTRVMYRANISYTMLQNCLLQLQRCELLEVHCSVERYVTTKKGRDFLNKWKELQELLQP